VYVVSLSDYNEQLYEEEHTNRMTEGLKVFGDTLNNEMVRKVAIFVIFSKKDVLARKLENYPISKVFPEFRGDSKNVEEVADYIKAQYLTRINKPEELDLTVHEFCILDGEKVQEFFEIVEQKASQLQQDGKLKLEHF
jgi:guanine nucleotide-binding protein G(i) subunit alpha